MHTKAISFGIMNFKIVRFTVGGNTSEMGIEPIS